MSKKFEVGSKEWIEYVCTYQSCDASQQEAFNAISVAAQQFLTAIFKYTPKCADQSAAIRLVRDARMTANTAIALKGII